MAAASVTVIAVIATSDAPHHQISARRAVLMLPLPGRTPAT